MALADLASQILDFTRIVTNADTIAPGKPFRVDVIPGVAPALPSVNARIDQGQLVATTLTGTIAGNIVGGLTGALRVLPHTATVKVTTTITRDGQAWIAPTAQPSPFSFAFLLVPRISAESLASVPTHYEIDVAIDVTVSTNTDFAGTTPPAEEVTASRTFTIPIDVPSLEIPAVLLLGRHARFAPHDQDKAGWLLVLVRGGSILKSAGDVVRTFSALMQTIRDLQSVLGWGGALAGFTGALEDAVEFINTAPTIFFYAAGARDIGDFDGEASSSLLIGTAGTRVSFYSQGGFNEGPNFNEEHTVFTLADRGVNGVSTGVGWDHRDDLGNTHWDTDAGENMNDGIESLHFEPPEQPTLTTPQQPTLLPVLTVKVGVGEPGRRNMPVTVIARDPVLELPLDGTVAIDSLGTVGRTNQPIELTLHGRNHIAYVSGLTAGYSDASVQFTLGLVVEG